MLYQILIYALNVIRSCRLPWGYESLMAYILWCIIYANMSICNTLENISSCFPVSCTTTILQISKRNRINSQVKFNDSFTLQVTQFQAHKIRCNNSCMLCTIQISSSQLKTNPRRISDGMCECRRLQYKTWSIYPLYTNKENDEFEIISRKWY